ncbi:glycoside hydrolase family 78 protein [Candidatus Pristimantibacillus sp. PTI5]|uniref:glycoside hydrolase family 78 protein n=1 Tax=Candidatus Pristimantibacillus sp. PTI5 TaxID=3400422 RepID=UPI003B011A57
MSFFTVTNLRVNYRKNPLGIDDIRPRLSWVLVSERRGFVQSAYQIEVAYGDDFIAALVWDSGKIESDRNIHIEYTGPTLKSRTRYGFRIRVWDDQGMVSEWSEPSYWETALLVSEEWQATWITAPSSPEDTDHEACDYVRSDFTVSGQIVSARVYATSLGLYRLFVNGEPADETLFNPGFTSYTKRLQYQTYDVTALISEGANTIGCMLGNGWYKGYLAWEGQKELFGASRAALIQLHVTLSDGSEQVIVSDGSWRASTGPLLRSELYHGETYDARLTIDGWSSPGFDDQAWPNAIIHQAPGATIVAQENEPSKVTEVLKPVAVITTPQGDTVLDMGQNMVGWVKFTVNSVAGTVITLQHAEVLDRDGNFYTGNLRSAKQTVTYICRGGGEETYEPYFSFQGFRYVKVTGVPKEQLMEHFVGCVIHTALEPTGSFACSDELVTKLQNNIVWGQRGNFLDIPTDCPQRDERLGWTGDAQVFIRTAAYNMNVVPFFEKWLKDLAADQEPDGRVPHVIPDIPIAGHGSSAWGDAAVICPWTLYECYGDTRVLETQYPSMKAWVEYMRAQGDNEYLWNTGFHFGDWLGLDAKENSYTGATPKDLIATAFYAYSTQLLAKTAAVIGNVEEAEQYRALHERIVSAFRAEFVTPSGRVASPTQTAYVLALMFDLLEEKDRPRTAKMLAENIEENGTRLTTGFVGTPYLNLVLSRFGYTDLAYRLLLQQEYPSWLFSVVQGATTIWEHWDGIKQDGTFWSDDMNSYNHYAYGAIGDWLYRVVGGIDLTEPGYKKIRIQPEFGERLTWADASYNSIHGTIAVAWKRMEGGAFEMNLTIPPNTTAEVFIPEIHREGISESGMPLDQMIGLVRADVNGEGHLLHIGSGSYRFSFIPNTSFRGGIKK